MNKKFDNWEKDYSFDNCGVGRKEHGEFLISYITGERDGFVLNLNGEWGSGKTEFLRRMRTSLMKDGYPVIYIDAWESDFCGDPLLVVASELLEQLESFFEVTGDDLDKVKEWIGRFARSAIVGTAGFLSKKITDDASIGMSMMKELMTMNAKDYLDEIKTGYLEQVAAIGNVRDNLGDLSKSLEDVSKKLPVVVLVDELDRCRPSYAIEMLEVIKHFFATRNFVFVVATDTAQLQHSIRAVYGTEFDSSQYLKRFFDREAHLPEPDLKTFINRYEFQAVENINIVPVIGRDKSDTEQIREYLYWGAMAYKLNLRGIDQAIAKLNACLRVCDNSETKRQINVFVLIMAIIEYEKNITVFESRGYNSPIATWEHEDFVIQRFNRSRDVCFSQAYKFNMASIVKYSKRSDYHGSNSTHDVYFTSMSQYDVDRGEHPQYICSLVDSLMGYVEQRNSPCWLWDDYKKLVTLAHSIN